MIIGDLFNNNFVGTVYYVSNSGSDSNNGITISTPFATLTKVNSLSLNPGDRVLFQCGGTWYGSLTLTISGSNGKNIMFDSYGIGAKPIITGFSTVSSWTSLGSNLWKSTNSVTSYPQCYMLTVSGVNTAMGRYPTASSSNGGYLTMTTTNPTSTSLTCSTLTGTPSYVGAEAVIRTANYKLERSVITSQTTNTINYTATTSTPPPVSTPNGFFIQNLPVCLSLQNDWCLLSGGYIEMYSTTTPTNVNVANIPVLITLSANYITIQNITFMGANSAGISIPSNSPYWSNININNCTFQSIGQIGISGNSNYLSILNNTFIDNNSAAINIPYGTNISITNNTLTNIGIIPGQRSSFVSWSNNFSSNSALACAQTTNYTVNNNSITNVGYCAITFFGTGMLIQQNFINTFCTVLDDGGGIYTYTGSQGAQTNQSINQNIIINGIGTPYGVYSRFPAAGIYLDNNSQNISVTNNSCANNYEYGIFMNSNKGNTQIVGNTLFNSDRYQLFEDFYWFSGSYPINTINNNILIAVTDVTPGNSSSYQKTFGMFCEDSTTEVGSLLTGTTLNDNYYARPIEDDYTITYNWNAAGGGNRNATLANWKSISGQDSRTLGSPEVLLSTNDITFYYNWSSSSLVQSLPYSCMDITGTIYSSSYTIPAYSSVVLLKKY